MDAGYGNDTQLRTDVTALGFPYVAGILSNTSVWAQGTAPLPPKPWSGRGRPPKLMRRDNEHQPTSVKALALALAQAAWTETPGARAQPIGSPRALRGCGCEPLIAIIGSANRARRNGS